MDEEEEEVALAAVLDGDWPMVWLRAPNGEGAVAEEDCERRKSRSGVLKAVRKGVCRRDGKDSHVRRVLLVLLGAGGCRDWSCRQRRQVKVELDVRLACLSARRNLTGAFVRVVMVGMYLGLPVML